MKAPVLFFGPLVSVKHLGESIARSVNRECTRLSLVSKDEAEIRGHKNLHRLNARKIIQKLSKAK